MAVGIEIERRAALSEAQRDELLTFMRSHGPVREVKRVMIDFSGEERRHTVAVRINNDAIELVAKSGGLTDKVRLEATPQIALATSLEEILAYMHLIGHDGAMVSLRHMHIAEVDDLEYSVRDVMDYQTGRHAATLLDLEALGVAPGEEQAALLRLEQTLRGHSIEPFTDEAWRKWVKDIYEHVDGRFTYSPDNARNLIDSLEKAGIYQPHLKYDPF